MEISCTPAKFTWSNVLAWLHSILLQKTDKFTSVPPLHVGRRPPKQAVSSSVIEPVPVKPTPAIEMLMSFMRLTLLTLNSIVESIDNTPELVEASQGAVN